MQQKSVDNVPHPCLNFILLKDYRPTDHVKFRHVDDLLKMMASITRDDRFLDVLYDEEGGKPENMCEVLDRVAANGIAIGEAKGIDKARLESIKNLMKNVGRDHPAGYGCPGNTKIGAVQVRCKAVNRVRTPVAPATQFSKEVGFHSLKVRHRG